MHYIVLGEIVVEIGSYICMYIDLLDFKMSIYPKGQYGAFATGNL